MKPRTYGTVRVKQRIAKPVAKICNTRRRSHTARGNPMTEHVSACPFCTLPSARILGQNPHTLWIRDGYPVSAGHSLIIPRRHLGSFSDTSEAERLALLALLDEAKAAAETEFHPAGYNIGINDGPAAGQTVPHIHIHLIPRFGGDLPGLRGGVRWVIPHKADYWTSW